MRKENCTPSILSTDTSKVRIGLDFILDHFDPNALFPRTIMTKKLGYQKMIFSKEEAINFYLDSDCIDCRINAFPAIEKSVPNFILIDLDDTHAKIPIIKTLEDTLSNIKNRLDGYPTVLGTGNGYHIYQPLDCTVRLEDINDFDEFENPSNQFLRFEKEFLSDGYADQCSNPSLNSCLLRIPGSFNSKCLGRGLGLEQSKVRIINAWNCNRPSIGNQMGSFYAYLISEKIKSGTKRGDLALPNTKYSNSEIKWIENLLLTPLEDYRKYCIFRILVPYLVNIKELPIEKVLQVIVNWLSKCNTIKPLDFDPSTEVKNRIKYVRHYKPISLAKLQTENEDLYQILTNRTK